MLQDSPITGTGDLLINVQALEPMQIPRPTLDVDLTISTLVEKLIIDEYAQFSLTKINEIVYKLFNLDSEEIQFIDFL